MDKGTQNALHIRRLSEGGYVVKDGHFDDPRRYCADLFASQNIDDVLKFIRDMIVPIGPEPAAKPFVGGALDNSKSAESSGVRALEGEA